MKVVQTMRGLFPREALQVAVTLLEGSDGLELVAAWRVIEEGPDGAPVKVDAHRVAEFVDGKVLVQREGAASGENEMVPRDSLHVWVEQTESDNAMEFVTVWRRKGRPLDAPHARRDMMGCMLATPEVQLQFGSFNGQLILAAPPPVKHGAPGEDVTIGLMGQQTGIEQGRMA